MVVAPLEQTRCVNLVREKHWIARWGVVSLIAALVAAWIPTTLAHVSTSHGNLTIHDSEDGPPTGKVSCQFWIQGRDMSDATGTLRAFYEGDLDLGTWSGTPDGDGEFDFLAGPFTLPGEEEWEMWQIAGFIDGDHRTIFDIVHYEPCGAGGEPDGGGPSPSVPPLCDATLTADAREAGAVFLDWEDADDDANALAFYRVLRNGEPLAEVHQSEFLDETSEAGTTYTYAVEAHGAAAGGGTVFTLCGEVEVTAVPFFGGALFAIVALAGVLLAYTRIRRR